MLSPHEIAAAHAAAGTDDDAYFCEWRARELSRVDRAGLTYLDYTGAALYAESMVRHDAERLAQSVLGNPHSEHGPSQAASAGVSGARRAILSFLYADPAEYAVVLTSNATAACRLVGESFPFSTDSRLLMAADNHNSINGIREFARRRGAALATIPLHAELNLADPWREADQAPPGPSLLAYPAQSNFSGVRHPLEWIAEAQERGYRVLLDAAAFVPTADLRLDRVSPDFVALSLYKIAGYPTGLGALVARHEALAELRRPSFSGGTVHWVSVQDGRHRLLPGPSAFEDGTVPFLAVGAVAPALALVQAVGRDRLARHVSALTADFLSGLACLCHTDGTPAIAIHGPVSADARGATVAFTVVDAAGQPVPYWVVEREAGAAGFALRGGCFCNPGCAERAFEFPRDRTAACLEGLGEAFTVPRFASCLQDRAVGALRVSFGLGSIRRDVSGILGFLRSRLG